MTRPEPAWPPQPLHVAVDIAVFTVREGGLQALLWRRPYEPFEGAWALPGAFSHPDETLDDTARRALEEKTGLVDVWLEQLQTYDQPATSEAPGRDPRGRVVAVAYLALITEDMDVRASEGELDWWPTAALPALAFDHTWMLQDGIARLRAKTHYAPVAFQLLPDEFTLPQLQGVYEAVMGEPLDPRNFRRDLKAAGVVEPTGGTRSDGPGRPATLYRYVPGSFAGDAAERRVAERIRSASESGVGGD